MRRLVTILIFIAGVICLTSCQKKKYGYPQFYNLGISGSNAYYQLEDGKIRCIDLSTGTTVVSDLRGDIYIIGDKTYVTDGRKLNLLSNGTLNIVGVADDEQGSKMIGMIGDWCYYENLGRVSALNYKTAQMNYVCSFPFGSSYYCVTEEGVFCGGDEGLSWYSFADKQTRTITKGCISGLCADEKNVYYSVSLKKYDPQNQNKGYYEYKGASVCKYSNGEFELLCTNKDVWKSNAGLACKNGWLFGVGSDSEGKQNVLWWIDDEGNQEQITLSEEVDIAGGFAVSDDYVVLSNEFGPKMWIFDRRTNKLKAISALREEH